MKYIQINPLDSLFFRGGKPFSKGDESWVDDTLVLPYPSVFVGALISSLISKSVIPLPKSKEEAKNALEQIKIKGIFLHHQKSGKLLTPAPLDLFQQKNASTFSTEKYSSQTVEIYTSVETKAFVEPDSEHTKNSENYFIDYDDLTGSYLKRLSGKTYIFKVEDFACKSPKIGIARSKTTRSAEESQLYKIEMIQFQDQWGYVIAYESKLELGSGTIKLGGDNRTAHYSSFEYKASDIQKEDTSFFKVYFQTPTFFESGDGLLEMQTLSDCKLQTACIGKPISIGGFDVNAKVPKPMRKAIPAGSVYTFAGDITKAETQIDEILDKKLNSSGYGNFIIIPFKKN